jgi:uncharacterized protein (DUF1778 family)
MPRTSLLIRLSHEDAARIRKEASFEYRSLSGYLLSKLERSIRVEETFGPGHVKSLLSKQARALIGLQDKKLHTAVHLRCTVEEAAKIREYAARRQLSISDFVIFSLRRSWQAVERLRLG